MNSEASCIACCLPCKDVLGRMAATIARSGRRRENHVLAAWDGCLEGCFVRAGISLCQKHSGIGAPW